MSTNYQNLTADVVHVGGLFPVRVELELYTGALTAPSLEPVRAAINVPYRSSLLSLSGVFQVNGSFHNPKELVDNSTRPFAPGDVPLWVNVTRDGEPTLWTRSFIPFRLKEVLTALTASEADGLTNLELIRQFGAVSIIRDLNRVRSLGAIVGSHLLGRNPDQHERPYFLRRFVLGSEISFTPPPSSTHRIDIRDVAEAISVSSLIRNAHRLQLQKRSRAGLRRADYLFDRPVARAIREGRMTPGDARLAPIMPGLEARLEAKAAKRRRSRRRHANRKGGRS